jgi:hypothetical protein
MNKKQIIEELNDVIRNLNLDHRQKIKGIKIMIADYDWNKRKMCNDSNLLIEWD